MLESAIEGLVLVVQWPAIGYLVLGVLLGLWFGAVPGLSGLTGLAILMPFTFGVPPVEAFALLLGMFAVTTTGDTISAVLLGVPGTAAAAATILDGHPLAQRGEAARAFGAAFTCSAVGGVIGAAMLGLSLPIVRPLILSFGSPEFFMLGVLGLTMVGALSGDSLLKGLAGACIGVLVSTIGYSPQGAMTRYDFGITYLMDTGLPIVPVVLGLFAIPETIALATANTSIARIGREDVRSGLLTGVWDACRHWWLILRASAIGIYIGILPGLGTTIVDWVAYGHAVQSAKDKTQFGKGDIRGVIAPEAANNAVKGGDLIPTIAFGIPGSTGMALMLGAFLIQGLTPGPEMLTTKLPITFSLMWTLALANILGAVVLMIWARQLAKVTFVAAELIVPAVVLFVFIGSWMTTAAMQDWYLMLVFGVIGIAMRAGGWPRAPLILGFVLGDIMETALDISIQSYGYSWMYDRPITMIITALCLLTIIGTVVGVTRRRRAPNAVAIKADYAPGGGSARFEAHASVPFAAVFLAIVGAAAARAWDWPRNIGLFPIAFAMPAVALIGAALIADLHRIATRSDVPVTAQFAEAMRSPAIARTAALFGWFAFIIAVTYIAGQLVSLPLFMAAYLLAKGRSWRTALLYAVCGWAMLYGMFDRIIGVAWHPSLLFDI